MLWKHKIIKSYMRFSFSKQSSNKGNIETNDSIISFHIQRLASWTSKVSVPKKKKKKKSPFPDFPPRCFSPSDHNGLTVICTNDQIIIFTQEDAINKEKEREKKSFYTSPLLHNNDGHCKKQKSDLQSQLWFRLSYSLSNAYIWIYITNH